MLPQIVERFLGTKQNEDFAGSANHAVSEKRGFVRVCIGFVHSQIASY
jgi:hypothetical protein